MYFDDVLGLQERTGQPVVPWEAVRGVAFRGSLILMVRSELGDYKLPGGGVEGREGHREALTREIAEETGYQCLWVGELIGRVLERRADRYDSTSLFEMASYYYLCEVSDRMEGQTLDDYKRDLKFSPVWISIPEALAANRAVLESFGKKDLWTRRENHVLLTIWRLQKAGVDLTAKISDRS